MILHTTSTDRFLCVSDGGFISVLLQWLHWHADDTSEGDKPSQFSDAFPCGWASHHCLTKWKPLWPAILFDIMPAAPVDTQPKKGQDKTSNRQLDGFPVRICRLSQVP